MIQMARGAQLDGSQVFFLDTKTRQRTTKVLEGSNLLSVW